MQAPNQPESAESSGSAPAGRVEPFRGGSWTGRSTWIAAIAGAVLAGIVAWVVGEASLDHFKPSAAAAAEPYAFTQLNLEKDRADGLNAAVAYGALGAAVGLALGVVGGLSRRSTRSALIAGFSGLVLGAIAGAVTSPLIVPLHRKYYEPAMPDMKLPILIHGGIWCALGLAGGLAFGIGRKEGRTLVVIALGGLIGAALATILYDSIGGIAFPASLTDLPIAPSAPMRLMARIFVALGVAIGACWAASLGRRPSLEKGHGLDLS